MISDDHSKKISEGVRKYYETHTNWNKCLHWLLETKQHSKKNFFESGIACMLSERPKGVDNNG